MISSVKIKEVKLVNIVKTLKIETFIYYAFASFIPYQTDLVKPDIKVSLFFKKQG